MSSAWNFASEPRMKAAGRKRATGRSLKVDFLGTRRQDRYSFLEY